MKTKKTKQEYREMITEIYIQGFITNSQWSAALKKLEDKLKK